MTEHPPLYVAGPMGVSWRCIRCGATITHLDAKGKSEFFFARIAIYPQGIEVRCPECQHANWHSPIDKS